MNFLETIRFYDFDWRHCCSSAGFGDAVDNTQCWDPIINYVENQFDNYLDAEMRVTRFPIADQRVHVCLYFIAPTGHALKPLDIEFMKRIHDKVRFLEYFRFL